MRPAGPAGTAACSSRAAAARDPIQRQSGSKYKFSLAGYSYRELLTAAPDAMVVVNQRGEIVLLNAQAEKQFGYPPDMQMLATETVLKQAELIATEMTGMD